MPAREVRRQHPRGREQGSRERLREVHLVDVAGGEIREDPGHGLPVARRRHERCERAADGTVPGRGRRGEPFEPGRSPGAAGGAEQRVLPTGMVVGEQRVVAAQHGERTVARRRDAVARWLDQLPELVAEAGNDAAGERKRQRGVHERRLGDEALHGRQDVAAGAC